VTPVNVNDGHAGPEAIPDDPGAGFATGQVEVERMAVEIGLEVDFCRDAAPQAAEGLMLPPLLHQRPRRERAVVLSKSWIKCAVSLHSTSI